MISPYMQIVFEFLSGGLLLYLSVRSKLIVLNKVLSRVFNKKENIKFYLTIGIRVLVGIVGAHLFLDPLIPGQAIINIHSPAKYPTVAENLCVRIAPIKFNGEIDTTRISDDMFPKDSIINRIVVFHVMEQYLDLRLYDITDPKNPISVRVVYLSPYVRRGVIHKNVYF